MNIVVIDIGGTNVKVWRSGETEKLKIPSGPTLGPRELVDQVRHWVNGGPCDRISIGYPGDVLFGRPVKDPYNLGPGWLEFDFADAFKCPVRVMNDACMQALGSYDGGRMLYLGLGTGVGTTFMVDGKIVPLALGHLRLTKNKTLNDLLCRAGLDKYGVKRWSEAVAVAAMTLKGAFHADYVMLGGGNAKKLPVLPPDCRRGSNFNAYLGGLRMWDDAAQIDHFPREETVSLRVGT